MSSNILQVSADKKDSPVKTSSNQERVDGGDVASPTATIERVDDAADHLCKSLEHHGPRISNETKRCWSEMSCSQRKKFSSIAICKADPKQRKTQPEDAHIFQGFSAFLNKYNTRYCNVFTNEQIWEAAKRDWTKMSPRERAKISMSELKTKRSCSKPAKMACPKSKIARNRSRPKVTKKGSKPKPSKAKLPISDEPPETSSSHRSLV